MIESSTIKSSPAASPATSVARVAGLGTIYITASKLWFIVSGLAIHFTLPRVMTDAHYGLYQVVIGVVSVVNAVVVVGTYQTVSKFVSQDEESADAVKSKALKLQVVVGGSIALGFFLLAPLIAGQLNDRALANYLRLASLITLSYAFYSVFTGYFNGLRRFLTQAALDITYSTLKLILIVALAWVGWGVGGAIGGFALAAAGVVLISAIAAQGRGAGEVRARDLLQFQVYVLALTLVLNLLQKIDLILVKALSSTDPLTASENAGHYGAAINLANISYQVIISVTFVVFPLVSQATFANDNERAKTYVKTTLRYALMVMALPATLFSANAGEALRVVFPETYQAGAPALAVVAYGMLLFGVLQISATIISASGRPRVSLVIGAVTLTTSLILNAALIPSRGLAGAALGTTVAMLVGAAIACGYLMRSFGAVAPWLSVTRIAAASALVYLASFAVDVQSRPLIIGKFVLLSVVYLVSLVASREIGQGDVQMLRSVLRPRKQ